MLESAKHSKILLLLQYNSLRPNVTYQETIKIINSGFEWPKNVIAGIKELNLLISLGMGNFQYVLLLSGKGTGGCRLPSLA